MACCWAEGEEDAAATPKTWLTPLERRRSAAERKEVVVRSEEVGKRMLRPERVEGETGVPEVEGRVREGKGLEGRSALGWRVSGGQRDWGEGERRWGAYGPWFSVVWFGLERIGMRVFFLGGEDR